MARGYNDLFKVQFGTQLGVVEVCGRIRGGNSSNRCYCIVWYTVWKQRWFLMSKCFSVASSVICLDYKGRRVLKIPPEMQSSVPNSIIPVFSRKNWRESRKRQDVQFPGWFWVWGFLKSEQESYLYKVRLSRWNESKTLDDQTLKAVRT